MATPLIDSVIVLERIPGKGGWTYARISILNMEKENTPFGMIRVKGSVDGYEIDTCSIMPMGNGALFLPIKAAIRKVIKKEEGDSVHIILYKDDEPYQMPEDLKERFMEAGVYTKFIRHKQWEQRMCTKWIFSAKRPETVNERILKTIFRLNTNQKIV